MMSQLIDWVARGMSSLMQRVSQRAHSARLREFPGLAANVSIGVGSKLVGPKENFYIGKYTYINGANLSCGSRSKIVIGEGCAIGYNVSIKAITHSPLKPTNNAEGGILHVEKDIVIGDNCWIGDNVFIREGITLGNNVTVGANAVVTRSFGDGSTIVGVPAREV